MSAPKTVESTAPRGSVTAMTRTPEPPARERNYIYVRDRHETSVEWVRAEVFDPNGPTPLPRPLGMLNGCFDILHSGHMKLLFQARDRCRTLVVAMDSDRRVYQTKGAGRPVLSWIERATALGYFHIDYLVEIDSDEEMAGFVARVRPDWRMAGAEYAHTETRFPGLKKLFVRSEGMRTSEIIRRCRASGPSEDPNVKG